MPAVVTRTASLANTSPTALVSTRRHRKQRVSRCEPLEQPKGKRASQIISDDEPNKENIVPRVRLSCILTRCQLTESSLGCNVPLAPASNAGREGVSGSSSRGARPHFTGRGYLGNPEYWTLL